MTADEDPVHDYPCSTPGCPGDGRFPAPGRGHQPKCTHPMTVPGQAYYRHGREPLPGDPPGRWKRPD